MQPATGTMQITNELKLDRSLLDKDFIGYKLSLSPVPVYKEDIVNGVQEISPSQEQYSFLHQRLFSLHNHLVADPWDPDTVYFVDAERHVQRSWLGQDGRLEKTVSVFELLEESENCCEVFNASISFPSEDTCILSDGCGTIFLLDTKRRSHGDVTQWKVLYKGQPLESGRGYSICDSTICPGQIVKCVHCIVQFVVSPDSEQSNYPKKPVGHETVLTWLVLSEEIDGSWTIQKSELRGRGPLDYLALEQDGKGLYVISEATFLPPEATALASVDEFQENDDEADFEWEQTFDDIKVSINLPVDVEPVKSDVSVNSQSTSLSVTYKGVDLLSGKLTGAIDPLLTSWSITKSKILEIFLQKYLEGTMWLNLIKSDKKGKEIPNSEVVEQVHNQLEHLTSDKEEAVGQVLNSMEECDAGSDESRTLQRFDHCTLQCTNKVHLGSQQWLLTGWKEPGGVPSFCMRNDVDGCIWMPQNPNVDTKEWKVEHVGTLLAFGYIQASKTNKKFTVVPPDFSYVAIIDVTGHVIIYRKGISVNTTVRNRRTGRQLKEIAVQQLVNLQTSCSILGAVATNDHIFVLSKTALYSLHVAVV